MKDHLANFKLDIKNINSNLDKSIEISKGIINSA